MTNYMIKRRPWIPKKEIKRAYYEWSEVPNPTLVLLPCDYEDVYDEDDEEVFL